MGLDAWLWGLLHMPCLFHWLTGLYCPGCGGTRAVKYLLTGHPFLSFQYHPLVLYVVAAGIVELICHFGNERLKASAFYRKRVDLLLYGGVTVMAINWVVKNFCLVALHVDLLAVPLF